jgi:DNA repair ATPase RecN
MKRIGIVVLIGGLLLTGSRVQCQTYEAEQLLLDWEKLSQLKQILKDMYKGYQIVEKGYVTIRDISQGNFSLHKAFLDGLLAVSPAVRNYYKIAEIIHYQLQIVQEYKQAYGRFQQDSHFNPDEIVTMGDVYGKLFDRSVHNLSDLATVLTDGQLRASDDERLKRIDDLHHEMQDMLSFLRQYNNRTALLSLQRGHDQRDIDQIKQFYGLN